MRIACLVLGYSAAPVLARSLPVLKTAGLDVFVHVDKKADPGAYRSSLGEMASCCTFVENSVEVFWGGYSMIEAELELITAARKANAYDKFLLISDDSFPVMPAAQLGSRLGTESDQITLCLQTVNSRYHKRYSHFFCYDDPATTVRGGPVIDEMAPRSVSEKLEHKMAEIAVLRRIGKKPVDVYYGSQFWALTSASVDLILKCISDDLHLVKSFQYSALPDETFFHSILGNCKFRRDLEEGPVYVDFSAGGPRTITKLADLPLDLQEAHLFLRKLSPSHPVLLQEIAARLESGFRIDGRRPGEPQTMFRIDGGPEASRVIVRLNAPGEGAGPNWHGVEGFWGRRFQWTASDEITWSIPGLPTGRVSFIITTVIAPAQEWGQACTLTFGGKTKFLSQTGGELRADFEYDKTHSPDVILRTPPLRSPFEVRGASDTRKLGLSVAF